jgi:REP element-mobilizing transposase RayT
MNRPVIAYHIIFGAYGFWLPNDPRGSMSRYVFAPRLQPFGPPKPVRENTMLTPDEARQLKTMRDELRYPAVRFSDIQIQSIGDAFGEIVGKLGLVLYAAAVMPDHVHVVAARQELYAETLAGYLKRAASRELRKNGLHPLQQFQLPDGRLPTPWGEHGWKIFLFTLDEIEHAVEYVNQNPVEAGLPRQSWAWIKPFEG